MTVFKKNTTEEVKAYNVELKMLIDDCDCGSDMLIDMENVIRENDVLTEEEFNNFVEFWKEEAKAMTENELGELFDYSEEPDDFEYVVFINEIV